MGCCGSGSREPKQKNNSSAFESAGDSASTTKKVVTWGLAIVVIVALIAWLI